MATEKITLKIKEVGMWEAFAKAQSEITPAEFNKINTHFQSSYADLASVWNACKTALNSNGFSIIQRYETSETNGPILITELRYKNGEFISSTFPLKIQKNTVQELGSLTTYARRYSLSALVGIIAEEDDDAEAANKIPTQVVNKTVPRLTQTLINESDLDSLTERLEKFHSPKTKDDILKFFKKTELKELSESEHKFVSNNLSIKERENVQI